MLNTILHENWLIEIANVSAQLKTELAVIPVEKYDREFGLFPDSTKTILDQINKQEQRAKRLNALRTSDSKLLIADPQYATRASSNTAHFLIARPNSNTSEMDYAAIALESDSKINAIGVYAWYHIKALQKASRLGHDQQLTKKQRQILTRSMLADEGFALHFLEDVFSAGHIAGTWGTVSQRLGTHNYYNQHGLEVYTWNRDAYPVVLMGDAHMRQQDKDLAAKSISTSLKQVISIAMGKNVNFKHSASPITSTDANDFNVCTQKQFYKIKDSEKYDSLLADALIQTPIPGLGIGFGALPRFRSEVGSFIGLAGSIDFRASNGGYLDSQNQNGYITGLDLSVRAGFGMDGVMNDSGDGLVYASFGFRSDSASSNKFTDALQATESGSISAAIPARSGVSFRFRMPFYLIPTDLFWLSPLYLIDETSYTNMAVTAGNGGLIPWQQGIATSIGRFQFVLGRELGVTLYGRSNSDQLIIQSDSISDPINLINYKSILFDLPIVEYRPYRSFSSNQSSSVIVQLYASADVPQGNDPIVQNGVSKSLETVWSVGLRLVFDWRHY
jgi:hypothetical protein